MSLFRRFTYFFRKTLRRGGNNRVSSRNDRFKKKSIFSKKLLECKIILLDGTGTIINLETSCLGCDLMNQVLIQLDIIERDYFSLVYFNEKKIECWLDPVKKVKNQIKSAPYEFYFRVKFYAIDPDQLSEELTRYHFFLQLKDDIIKKKLLLPDPMSIELAALAIQSELGDYEPELHVGNYIKDANTIPSQLENFEKLVADKHHDLVGYTPAECEINFLKLIKCHELYGVERYTVNTGSDNIVYSLGLAPRGIILLRSEQKVGFYPWNRINLIGFKRKSIRIFIQNRLDATTIDKFNFNASSVTIAKSLWKSAIEHHSFFRLIRVVKNNKDTNKTSDIFGSKFRYSGRTFYEASRASTRISKRQNNFKRSQSINYQHRSTIGYIRIGSRVFAKAENGEYFKGKVITLSDKVYVHCDDGVTLAHPKNSVDTIVFDSDPDPSEVIVGSRVIAYWPGISTYLCGNISAIDGVGNYSRYLIAFDDGDTHWNNTDQIRLLKPPMYFGPGSNSTYLQKKYSMLKTTTLVNFQINQNTTTPPLSSSKKSYSVKDNESIINNHLIDTLDDSSLSKFTPYKVNELNLSLKTLDI